MDISTWDMSEELSPEQLLQIWDRRAAQLAQLPQDLDAGEQTELLVVQIGSDFYGLDVQCVHDIRLIDHITRVPRTPDWVAGLVNVRGHVFSAIHLQSFFALTETRRETEITTPRFIVVISMPNMEIALLADNVLAVSKFPTRQIASPQDLAGGIPPQFVTGVTRWPDTQDFIIVLNLPAIVGNQMLILHEKVRS